MTFQVLYSADLHGNEAQYHKLVDEALHRGARAVVIGGDILPKGLPHSAFISGQREFVKNRLPALVGPLKEAGIPLYLMLGNDDCAANLDALASGKNIHGRRLPLTGSIDIVGYGFVPVTPFGIKDWEKYDFSTCPPELAARYATRKAANYNLRGWKTDSGAWKEFHFTPALELRESIQLDLEDRLYRTDAGRTLYVVHTPPDDTCLDVTAYGQHVGSLALRRFIEETQPLMTLHGHVHETVEMTGEFMERIGSSICASPGNTDAGDTLRALWFDAERPEGVERLTL